MNRSRAGLVGVVVLGFVAALIVAWLRNEPKVPVRAKCVVGGDRPCSTQVEEGKAYTFQVLHCGLRWIADFDGSYWDVDGATMTEEEDIRFGSNSDEGTMTLEDQDRAVYRSSRGGEATLRRHRGAFEPAPCA